MDIKRAMVDLTSSEANIRYVGFATGKLVEKASVFNKRRFKKMDCIS